MARTSRALLPTLAAAILLAACGSSRSIEDNGDGGPHPAGFGDPGVHGPAALADLTSCQTCHGADYGGGLGPSCTACHESAGYANWTSNCTFCHYSQKVQTYTAADLPKAAPATGAHPRHIAVNVACTECHTVPTDLAHVNGAAPLHFGPLASTGGNTPSYAAPNCSSVYCHGGGNEAWGGTSTTPAWNGGPLTCTTCHAVPPPTASPLAPNNGHVFHNGLGVACATCHTGYTATSVGATHVNGQKNFKDLTGAERTDGWDGTPQGTSTTQPCSLCHTG